MSERDLKIKGILLLLEQKNFSDGYVRTNEWVDECEKAFAEELTVNTATDFVASAILFSQFSSAEKKPWKAIPQLRRIGGALRFLEDYISDQSILSDTMVSVADLYSYAAFFPEASLYYQKAAALCADLSVAEDLYARSFFYALRGKGTVSSEFTEAAKKKLASEKVSLLLRQARCSLEQGLQFDPVEQSEAYLAVRYEVEKAVDEALVRGEFSDNPSYCLRYWEVKRYVLNHRFGICWKSPDQINPQIQFQ